MTSISDEKRAIAFFLPSLGGGGAEKTVVMLANRFAEQGHQVDLLLANAEGIWLDYVSSDVNVIDLHLKHALQALPHLVRYLDSRRASVLLSTLDTPNLVALWAKRKSRGLTAVVITAQTPISRSWRAPSSILKKLIKRTFPLIAKKLYPTADKIIAVSEGVREDLIETCKLPNELIETIYNPIDADEIETKSREHVEHPWLEDSHIPLILSVGRLSAPKDYTTLIEAFSMIRKSKPCRLLILGKGPERSKLIRLASRLGLRVGTDIELGGFVTNPYPYMAKATLFALSSRWEGFGIVIAEAMACGCPIVCTDAPGGPAEILKHGRYGLLVPTRDPEALARAMRYALKHEFSRDCLKRRSRDFPLDATADAYLRVLDLSV